MQRHCRLPGRLCFSQGLRIAAFGSSSSHVPSSHNLPAWASSGRCQESGADNRERGRILDSDAVTAAHAVLGAPVRQRSLGSVSRPAPRCDDARRTDGTRGTPVRGGGLEAAPPADATHNLTTLIVIPRRLRSIVWLGGIVDRFRSCTMNQSSKCNGLRSALIAVCDKTTLSMTVPSATSVDSTVSLYQTADRTHVTLGENHRNSRYSMGVLVKVCPNDRAHRAFDVPFGPKPR